ncbi:MAG: DNA repair protein RecO [Robiginitomaculum sp.]|nr:MAG: DNA repair protein RecO [Robiginitomaculum sp.]
MEWSGEGYILSVKPHGETSAIVDVFTIDRGRHAGLVRGGRSRRMRPVLQSGNKVSVDWHARLSEHLGNFNIEALDSHAALLMNDRLALTALNSISALIMSAIPERESHPNLYQGYEILLQNLLDPDIWPALYVRFEIALLHALGYGLDFSSCAATGALEDLTHVSPRSGRAVCAEAAEPYLDKLMRLPDFLKGGTGLVEGDIEAGFKLSGYFLTTRIYHPINKDIPDARSRLITELKTVGIL